MLCVGWLEKNCAIHELFFKITGSPEAVMAYVKLGYCCQMGKVMLQDPCHAAAAIECLETLMSNTTTSSSKKPLLSSSNLLGAQSGCKSNRACSSKWSNYELIKFRSWSDCSCACAKPSASMQRKNRVLRSVPRTCSWWLFQKAYSCSMSHAG